MSTERITETYRGYVGSTKDALLVTQAMLNQQLSLIPRRPTEKERPDLIKSGNVFVFIEEYLGIKRWTDGIAWSPLRILGRFLVYRELDKNSLNEKDDKKKKKRKVSIDQVRHNSNPTYSSGSWTSEAADSKAYVSRDQGLIKKTMSIATNSNDLELDKKNQKMTIHLICYYNADDVLNGTLLRPSENELKDLSVTKGLWDAVKETQLGGKIPIEDEAYYYLDSNYQLQNMSTLEDEAGKTHSHTEGSEQSPQLHYGGHQQQKFTNQGAGSSLIHMLPVPIQPPSFMYKSHKEEYSPYLQYRLHHRKESSEGNHVAGPPHGATTSEVNYGAPLGSSANYAAQTAPYYNSYMIPPQVKSYLFDSGSPLQGMNHPMLMYPQPSENFYQSAQQQYLPPQTLQLHPSYNYMVPTAEAGFATGSTSTASNQPKSSGKFRALSTGNGHLLGNYAAYPIPAHGVHVPGQPNVPQSSQSALGQQPMSSIPGEEQITTSFSSSNYANST